MSSVRWKVFWLLNCALPVLSATPIRPDDPEVWYCSNQVLKSTIESVLAKPHQDVDVIQASLETELLPYFEEYGGKWFVSVSKFHRLSGYVDNGAKTLPTFCAIHDLYNDFHVVIVKVE
ncbi:hypothetical protein Q1695_005605 [Nippostrongylus brasiliensis]|nr:hypothetical protein Q1695_005605 [Nippostrongylus brasiliensis]